MTDKAEILTLYKNLGETPLECLLRFKEHNSQYAETKMTYLGRLDPMAEGLLLVLAGNTRDKDQYLALDKTYEFEILWGFKTDTHDILGLVEEGPSPQKLEIRMASLLKKVSAIKKQEYPLFSSRMFGKDFLKARGASVDGIERPEKDIRIFDLVHIHTRSITGREILREISERIAKVDGDFRQEQVLSSWHNTLATKQNEFYLISKFRADVSSGTYIRGLASEMGKLLSSAALAWSIKRTRVGERLLTVDL